MAIGIIATLEIKPGEQAAFERIFSELAAEVRANETGNHFYALHKSRSSDTTYVVLEQYEDAEALAAHNETDYFKRLGAAMGPHMAGRPKIEMLDAV
ncbi:MAG: antibiotic biosynthesis monooxygenase [Pseudomonadales bacterium]|jgi:quinol monooxygenase YgiN|nr:antibiotic biosynthesis monooxygenase [Pseudomonadales bacterium]MDA0761036.1 putative quinol monooxygenase [Pseudomonadota bacterium]MDA0957614.1 putative quinol monooxygenase [Pseudomonadota bacterium]MDA1207394.1 putative quinol monooxygenase [Pseudomonadota bacterium]